ncbi:MAG: tetratricopeptide repeat protein [Eubacterium sp.]
MSRGTEKLFKELHKFMDQHSVNEDTTEEEINELIDQFMAQYNAAPHFDVTEETAETSDDYVDLALDAEDDFTAAKHLKKALALDPDNLDAERLFAEYTCDDNIKLMAAFEKVIQHGQELMADYLKDDVGDFYGILETRPYMRALYGYANLLLENGMIGLAEKTCREMIRLNHGDNLGARYLLMHIYAYFEDEESALELHREYLENSTMMLLPLSVLYYKKNDMSTAKKYLRKLLDVNKDTKKFFKIAANLGQTDPSDWPQDGYLANSIQEYLVAYSENLYLYDTLEVYFTWADRALSKMRKSNKGRR